MAENEINGLPYYIHFDQKDYDVSNGNEAILQTADGIVYVANQEGLLVYDNSSWKRMALPNKTRVRSIAKDNNGKIYIGGQGEFGFMAPDSINNINYISLSDSIDSSDRFLADIWHIWALENTVLFLSNKQLLIYSAGKVTSINSDTYFRHGFQVGEEIFVQEMEKGMFRWDGKSLAPVQSDPMFKEEVIAFIEPLEENKWLIGMENEGIFIGNFEDQQRYGTEIKDRIGTVKMNCGLRLKDGKLLIGTLNHGLIVLDPKGSLLYNLNKNAELNMVDVLDLKLDLSGQVWVVSNIGLTLVDVNSPLSIIDERLGVPGAGFTSANLPNGSLMLGTSQGSYLSDGTSKSFSLIPESIGIAWYMKNIDDQIWIGHQSTTLKYYKGQITDYDATFGTWDFMKTSDPNIIIAGNYNGVHVFRKEGNVWEFSNHVEDINESSRQMVLEPNHVLWMSHPYKGIYKLTLDTELKKCNKVELFGEDHGLPSNIRLFVFKVKDQLIFTSEDGIYTYDESTNTFVSCAWLEKILGKHSQISKFYEDDLGNIWFVDGGKPGYIHFEAMKQPVLVTDPFIAMHDKMIPTFEHIQAYGDKILFGMQTGYLLYDFTVDTKIEYPFPVSIRKVEQPGNPNTVIDHGFASQSSIPEFSFAKNGLKFSYTGVDYHSNDKILYRYKLQGFDESWSDWSSNNVKEYTNLTEGSYAFIVEGKNLYGRISRSSAWQFELAPPWYRTWVALLFFAIIFGLIIYTIIKIYTQYRLRDYKHKELFASQEMIRLKNENLQNQVRHNSKQLASIAFSLAQKENAITNIKKQLEKALDKPELLVDKIGRIANTVNSQLNNQEDWEVFERHFDQVHNMFMTRLRENHPDLSPIQNKLCAYLRMNLSSKEIADLMNVSVAGVEKNRYRLRKKFDLSPDDNLKEFVFQI